MVTTLWLYCMSEAPKPMTLNSQRQCFAMINANSYNVVVWVTSQYSRPLITLWRNRKQQAAILDSFNPMLAQILKTSLLPNIRDDAINALL
jgi:hypothetical protein